LPKGSYFSSLHACRRTIVHRRATTTTKKPSPANASPDGSGAGVPPPFTVKLASSIVKLIGLKFESRRITFARSIEVVPGASPVNCRTASVPLPLTPGIAPISESGSERGARQHRHCPRDSG
jgi:hypothetical protein